MMHLSSSLGSIMGVSEWSPRVMIACQPGAPFTFYLFSQMGIYYLLGTKYWNDTEIRPGSYHWGLVMQGDGNSSPKGFLD